MLNPLMRDALLAQADVEQELSYASYIATALYTPEVGYYRKEHHRVGQQPTTDFYTATSLGPLFGQLVAEASATLLAQAEPPFVATDCTFFEVGAETNQSVLDNTEHPFKTIEKRGIEAEKTNIPPTNPAVVFSNELFDAQPFERLVMTANGWAERRVKLTEKGLCEVRRPLTRNFPVSLPTALPVGYELDLPLGAVTLLRQLVTEGWKGAFLAFDYGLPWDILASERPQGTARTYKNHQIGQDLLMSPGEQDITCHVCWDWLEATLREAGFQRVEVMRQETALLQLAPQTVTRVVTDPTPISSDRQALKALLHPHHMGSKFQVLVGVRS